MRKLDEVIQVRVTSAQKETLRQEAERRHIRPADVVRWALSQVTTGTSGSAPEPVRRLSQQPSRDEGEKLRALLATAVESIIAAKDDMTESDLAEARTMIQKAIDELRQQYGID